MLFTKNNIPILQKFTIDTLGLNFFRLQKSLGTHPV